MFPLCHQVTYKDAIDMPCVIDGSLISTFAYTRSYTYIRQLFHITYHVKVIDG
jgi:hypothetical protein